MYKTKTKQERKADAREKIILGGLVVDAGLRDETPMLLLGALIDIKRRLEEDDGERDRLLQLSGAVAGDD